MQFTTADERSDYFLRLENPEYGPEWTPEYGAAMEHASTVKLGLWGDTSMLQEDCARIFIGELKRFGIEHGIRDLETRFSPSILWAKSGAFRAAFRAARIVIDGQTNNALASIIPAAPKNNRETLTDEEREALVDLHEKVLRDFRIPVPV